MASQLLGFQPTDIQALAHLGATDVDEQTGIILKYPQGQLVLLSSAVRTRTLHNAFIFGTEGIVWMPMFWRARLSVLWRSKKLPRITWNKAGYHYEAAEVNRCIRENKLESAAIPLADTLARMEILDQIRTQVGLRYPGE